ncbi:hypothetical protein [Vibrio lentus]|uniref:hypothetical protein n=1 Tax=Vibrio lentus TaxID=136468 RepID=UPI000C82EAA5|nr:hypothetical protein [Vibrio lentus]PMG78015.1 hypothetical protein BCU86_21085 [Vibrio lentus]
MRKEQVGHCSFIPLISKDNEAITSLMNEAWLRAYGDNSLFYTKEFFEDHFSCATYVPELSEGVYLEDGSLVGSVCAFDKPIYYKKLNRVVKSVFVTFLAADMKAMRITRTPIGTKLMINCFNRSKKMGYEQILTITATGETAEKRMRKAIQPIAEDEIRVVKSFNVYLLNRSRLNTINEPYDEQYQHKPLDFTKYDEYYDYYSSLIGSYDLSHNLNPEVMKHNWFDMKTKSSWEIRESGIISAVISASFSRTHREEEFNSVALECYIHKQYSERKKISLLRSFINYFLKKHPKAVIFIQNSSVIEKSVLRELGFYPTISKYNIVSFPLNGNCNFNADVENALINVF